MTFEKLKELINKHNIPYNAKLLSNTNMWEDKETEMDGIYYNKEKNTIIFTEFYNVKYESITGYKKLNIKERG